MNHLNNRKRTSHGLEQQAAVGLVFVTCWAGAVAEPGTVQASQISTLAESAHLGWLDWWEMRLQIFLLERILEQELSLGPTGTSDQAIAVAEVGDQTARYEAGGLANGLSQGEVQAGITDITSLRALILSSPTECTDAVWVSYLDVLDAMEADLNSLQTGPSYHFRR